MKGQVSIEFIVYFGLILLISTFFFVKHIKTDERLTYMKMDNEADKFTEKIVFEINSAVIAGDGYERRFYLEDKIGGYSDYNIQTNDYYVVVDWDGKSKILSIITESVNGSFDKGWNFIRNQDGVINVN